MYTTAVFQTMTGGTQQIGKVQAFSTINLCLNLLHSKTALNSHLKLFILKQFVLRCCPAANYKGPDYRDSDDWNRIQVYEN